MSNNLDNLKTKRLDLMNGKYSTYIKLDPFCLTFQMILFNVHGIPSRIFLFPHFIILLIGGTMKGKLISIILTFLMVSIAAAGGFELYEFGAASSSMSGAVVARSWDASTIFYNPAGIAFLKDGSHYYGGVTLITATNKYTGADPVYSGEEHTSVAKIHTPIGFYFSHQFNETLYAGIGVTNPFGLGLEWEEDFPGRSISYNNDLYMEILLYENILDYRHYQNKLKSQHFV